MNVPETHEVAYQCPNGHVNTKHKVKLDGDFRDGKRPACLECGERLTRQLVPLYECNTCGNTWPYTGDAERVTCPNCRGKNTEPVASE